MRGAGGSPSFCGHCAFNSGVLVAFGGSVFKFEMRLMTLATLSLAMLFFAVSSAIAAPLSLTPPQISQSPAPQTTDVAAQNVPDVTSVNAPAALAPVLQKPVVVKKRFNVVIFGDSLGDGVWAGLYHALRKDKRFNVIRKSKVATGFVRRDYYDWNEAVREATSETTVDIAVVVMGTNDRQIIVENGARYALFSPKWREVYTQRVDDFTATLKASGARIYWVGLPVMRGQTFENDMLTFSRIFADRAAENGVTFLPTHDLLADDDGKYSAYGLDGAGRKRLLRAEDGIHFTMPGYEKLVTPIARAIKQDVDGGTITADASAIAVSAATAETSPAKVGTSVDAIGLKAQIYDVAESRPGRSDDWSWKGAER